MPELKSPYMVADEGCTVHRMPHWEILNKKSRALLADVEWYPRWRRFILDIDGVVFSEDCLRALADFLRDANAEHRKGDADAATN